MHIYLFFDVNEDVQHYYLWNRFRKLYYLYTENDALW